MLSCAAMDCCVGGTLELPDQFLKFSVIGNQAAVDAIEPGHLTPVRRQLGLQCRSLLVQCLDGINNIRYRGNVVQTHAAKLLLYSEK